MSAWVSWQRMPSRYQLTRSSPREDAQDTRQKGTLPRRPASARVPGQRDIRRTPSARDRLQGQKVRQCGHDPTEADPWSPRSAGLPARDSAYVNTLKSQRRIASARRYMDDEQYLELDLNSYSAKPTSSEVVTTPRSSAQLSRRQQPSKSHGPPQGTSPRLHSPRIGVRSPRHQAHSGPGQVSDLRLDIISPRCDDSSPRLDVTSPRFDVNSPRLYVDSPVPQVSSALEETEARKAQVNGSCHQTTRSPATPLLAQAQKQVHSPRPDVSNQRPDIRSPRHRVMNNSSRQVSSPQSEVSSPRPDVKSPRPDVKSPRPDANIPRPDVKNPRPDVKSPRPYVRSPRSDVKTPRSDVTSPRPDVNSPRFGISDYMESPRSRRGFSGRQLVSQPYSEQSGDWSTVPPSQAVPSQCALQLNAEGQAPILHPRTAVKLYDCVIGNNRMAAIYLNNGKVTVFRKAKPDVTQSVSCAMGAYRVTRDDGSYLSHLRKVYLTAAKDLPKTSNKEVDMESHDIITKRMDYDRKAGHILDYYAKVDVCKRLHSPRPPGTHQPAPPSCPLPGRPAFRTMRSRRSTPKATAVSEPMTSSRTDGDTPRFSPRSPYDYTAVEDESQLHVLPSDPEHFVRINVQARLHDRQFYLCTPVPDDLRQEEDQVKVADLSADGSTHVMSNCGCRMCCLEMDGVLDDPQTLVDTMAAVALSQERRDVASCPQDRVVREQHVVSGAVNGDHSAQTLHAPSLITVLSEHGQKSAANSTGGDFREDGSDGDGPQSADGQSGDKISHKRRRSGHPSSAHSTRVSARRHSERKASVAPQSERDQTMTVSVDLSNIPDIVPTDADTEDDWTADGDNTQDNVFHQSTQTDTVYCAHC